MVASIPQVEGLREFDAERRKSVARVETQADGIRCVSE
jgi:hypothetical protein